MWKHPCGPFLKLSFNVVAAEFCNRKMCFVAVLLHFNTFIIITSDLLSCLLNVCLPFVLSASVAVSPVDCNPGTMIVL